MNNTYKSSTTEQIEAEKIIFGKVKNILGRNLDANKPIFIADNAYTYIQPDFYSEKDLIIGEIFVHIGKPKKAQDNKISNDILKMLLLEKITNKKYRKILVVCDEAELKKLKGMSALAESIRQFDIELMYVEIEDCLREKIVSAQSRQKMTNA